MGKNRTNRLNRIVKLVILGILVTGILMGMIVYLNWAWDTYGRDYALSLASFFVATIVGLAVIFTLKLTRDSLELTRATIRPFLTFSNVTYEPISDSGNPEIRLILHNTGALPTGNISVEYELRLPSTGLIHGNQNQSPLFPNEKRLSAFLLPRTLRDAILTDTSIDREATSTDTNIDTEPSLTIRVAYRREKEYFHTERSFSLPVEVNRLDNKFVFLVVRGRDYWQ